MEYNENTTLAILDSGVGVAIATKKTWESWGKPALAQTRMRLQLTNAHVERPLGLLQDVIVTSCGLEYELGLFHCVCALQCGLEWELWAYHAPQKKHVMLGKILKVQGKECVYE